MRAREGCLVSVMGCVVSAAIGQRRAGPATSVRRGSRPRRPADVARLAGRNPPPALPIGVCRREPKPGSSQPVPSVGAPARAVPVAQVSSRRGVPIRAPGVGRRRRPRPGPIGRRVAIAPMWARSRRVQVNRPRPRTPTTRGGLPTEVSRHVSVQTATSTKLLGRARASSPDAPGPEPRCVRQQMTARRLRGGRTAVIDRTAGPTGRPPRALPPIGRHRRGRPRRGLTTPGGRPGGSSPGCRCLRTYRPTSWTAMSARSCCRCRRRQRTSSPGTWSWPVG